jgi:hypothetical protein
MMTILIDGKREHSIENQPTVATLLKTEIEWLREHWGESGEVPAWEFGFMAGMEHARNLTIAWRTGEYPRKPKGTP